MLWILVLIKIHRIEKMLEFLIDNIYVVVGVQVFQQSVGIPIGTNCAPLLADLFLYSYEAKFIQKLRHEKKKILAVAINSKGLEPKLRYLALSMGENKT
jgi:hypothetical protein